jgi:hypothetical protein
MTASPAGRAETRAALACAALALVLMGLRATSAVSFTTPLQHVTSGFEQESLLAIWEAMHGGSVYVDRLEIPYSWAVYNWLYYVVYAAFAEGVIGALKLSDSWLPTVTRVMTAIGAVAVALGSYQAFTLASGSSHADARTRNGAAAVFVAVGPLVGYWAITTRPDIWALALEIWAIVVFCRLHGTRPVAAVLAFCVVAYCAWAFKQTVVTGIGAVGMLLLVRRRWRELALLVVVMPSTWAATLLLGTENYFATMLLAGYRPDASLAHAVQIFFKTLPKALPCVFGITALALIVFKDSGRARRLLADDRFVLAAAGLGIGTVLASVPSMQHGAAENYYFAPVFFALLALIRSLQVCEAAETLRLGLAFGWGAQSLAVGAVLAGFIGTVAVPDFHPLLMRQKACLNTLPRPLFVDNIYLSLPWMTPGNPHFVLFYGYQTDRANGIKHTRGGIGGLISEGYFAALALRDEPDGKFDGAALDGYRRDPEPCADLLIYRRK